MTKAKRTAKKSSAPRAKKSKSRAVQVRADAVAEALVKALPNPRCELDFSTPFQLLVAVLLSAQTTDKGVNKVTPELFKKFPTAKEMAHAPEGSIEAVIRPLGYYNTKGKHLRALSKLLLEKHDGIVPTQLEALIELPGVARKTANVVLAAGFDLAEGFAVDTHVARVTKRLGLSRARTVGAMEKDLMALFPKETWAKGHLRLVLHGRYTCVARKPKCSTCPLLELCPSKEARVARTEKEEQPLSATVPVHRIAARNGQRRNGKQARRRSS